VVASLNGGEVMLSFEGEKFPFAVSSIVAVAVGFDENKDMWRICD
jgi:hypothetical protein